MGIIKLFKKLYRSFIWSGSELEFFKFSELGSKNFKQKRYFEAIAYFDKALNLRDYIQSELISNEYSQRGQAKLKIGDYKGAKKDFNKSIKQADYNFDDFFICEDYFYRGITKFYLKNFKGSLKDFYRAKVNKDEIADLDLKEIEAWIQKTKKEFV